MLSNELRTTDGFPMTTHTYLRTYLLVVFVAAALAGCSSTKEMSSDAVSPNMQIDGKADEWEGKLYIFKDQGLLAGVQDDSANVYVCLEGLDPATSRGMMRGGVTIWFDPGSGDSSIVGVHYGGRRLPPGGGNEEELFHPMAPSEIQVLHKGNVVAMEVPSVSSEREYGLKVALRDSGGAAVFEMKMPRKLTSTGFGLARVVDRKLSLEIETAKGRAERVGSKSESESDEPGGEEGRRGGGMRGGGRRGGLGGRGGGERGENRGSGPESVSLSLRVRLMSE